MAWHDIEAEGTVRKIVGTFTRNERQRAAAVPADGSQVPSRTRVWVQPPLPMEPAEPPLTNNVVPPILPSVTIKSIRIAPEPNGDWKVVVKASHSRKGPVYRYGIVLTLDDALETVQHFLGSDYWTPDKYA